MNNKLTIQELATLLSVKSGKDVYETERFIREFITVVSEGLFRQNGEGKRIGYL